MSIQAGFYIVIYDYRNVTSEIFLENTLTRGMI